MMYQYRLKLTDLDFEMVDFWTLKFHEMAVKRVPPLVNFIHINRFSKSLYATDVYNFLHEWIQSL